MSESSPRVGLEEPVLDHEATYGPDYFSAQDVHIAAEMFDPNPQDLTKNVPTTKELAYIVGLADKTSRSPDVDTTKDQTALNNDEVVKLWDMAEDDGKAWVITDPAERAQLETIWDIVQIQKRPELLPSGVIKQIDVLREEVKAGTPGLTDEQVTERAARRVAVNAKRRVELSDKIEVAHGTKTSEPAPTSTADDRNRPRGTHGAGAPAGSTTPPKPVPKPGPRPPVSTTPPSSTKKTPGSLDPADPKTAFLPPEAFDPARASKPAPGPGEKGKKPPTPLEEARDEYMKAYKQHLKDGGDSEDPDFIDRMAELDKKTGKAFRAEAMAAGKDPKSDEVKAEYDEFNAKMGKKIDKWLDKYESKEPDPDPMPDGKWARTKWRMRKAARALRSAPDIAINRAKIALTNEETGSRNRKIVGGVIGAALLAGTAIVAYKFGYADGVQDVANNAPKGGGGTPSPEAPAVAPPAPEVHHATVQSGDNVWKLVTEGNGGNSQMTADMINNGQVSVTGADGSVRTTNLDLVYAGDTVNYTLPTSGGAGSAAHEAASASANVEVLTPYDASTGSGTVSGATLDHLHDLNLEVPTASGAFGGLVDRVADYNNFSPNDLTHLPVGQEIHFPPRAVMDQWLQQLIEAEKNKKLK